MSGSYPRRSGGVILTHVGLGNFSDELQVFDLFVTHDEEVIHWASHEVEAEGESVIDIEGPGEHGSVEVMVRVGEEWQTRGFDTHRYEGERVIAVVVYGKVEYGLLRISRVASDRPTDEV